MSPRELYSKKQEKLSYAAPFVHASCPTDAEAKPACPLTPPVTGAASQGGRCRIQSVAFVCTYNREGCEQVPLILPVPLPDAGFTGLNGRHTDSKAIANT